MKIRLGFILMLSPVIVISGLLCLFVPMAGQSWPSLCGRRIAARKKGRQSGTPIDLPGCQLVLPFWVSEAGGASLQQESPASSDCLVLGPPGTGSSSQEARRSQHEQGRRRWLGSNVETTRCHQDHVTPGLGLTIDLDRPAEHTVG